jgi:uncharacterized Fe-S cluster-containing radical SAM superfamily enzyme
MKAVTSLKALLCVHTWACSSIERHLDGENEPFFQSTIHRKIVASSPKDFFAKISLKSNNQSLKLRRL